MRQWTRATHCPTSSHPSSPCRYEKWDSTLEHAIDVLTTKANVQLGPRDYLIARNFGGATKRFEIGVVVPWLFPTDRLIVFLKGLRKYYVFPTDLLTAIHRRARRWPYKQDGNHKFWVLYIWPYRDELAPRGYTEIDGERICVAEYGRVWETGTPQRGDGVSGGSGR